MRQRQDSVTDQLRDLRRIAIREGMYDADDWIKARLDPWDACLAVDPFTGQPDQHEHGDACVEKECCE